MSVLKFTEMEKRESYSKTKTQLVSCEWTNQSWSSRLTNQVSSSVLPRTHFPAFFLSSSVWKRHFKFHKQNHFKESNEAN